MLSRQERPSLVADASVPVGCDVSQFDERVAPVYGVEGVLEQLLEPGLVEVVQGILVLVPRGVHQLERAAHDETLALLDAAREVEVHQGVTIDVVESLSVGTVHADGHLPCRSPVLHVLACKRVGGSLEVDDHLLHPFAVALGEPEISERRVQQPVVGFLSVSFSCHVTSCV